MVATEAQHVNTEAVADLERRVDVGDELHIGGRLGVRRRERHVQVDGGVLQGPFGRHHVDLRASEQRKL